MYINQTKGTNLEFECILFNYGEIRRANKEQRIKRKKAHLTKEMKFQ